jgi:hypothetical protein
MDDRGDEERRAEMRARLKARPYREKAEEDSTEISHLRLRKRRRQMQIPHP